MYAKMVIILTCKQTEPKISVVPAPHAGPTTLCTFCKCRRGGHGDEQHSNFSGISLERVRFAEDHQAFTACVLPETTLCHQPQVKWLPDPFMRRQGL